MTAAFEQIDPEVPLEASDGFAQRGLGDVQRLGRPAKRAQSRNRGDVLELFSPHDGAPSSGAWPMIYYRSI